MPICPSCRIGYEPSEPRCPKCGEAKPVPAVLAVSDYPRQRCSAFSLFCLRFAQVASFVGVVVALFSSIAAIWQGYIFEGLIGLLIITPVSIGSFISFALVIQYARNE